VWGKEKKPEGKVKLGCVMHTDPTTTKSTICLLEERGPRTEQKCGSGSGEAEDEDRTRSRNGPANGIWGGDLKHQLSEERRGGREESKKRRRNCHKVLNAPTGGGKACYQ